MELKLYGIIILVAAIFLSGSASVFQTQNSLTFYNIGQGDAIHLRTKTGFDFIIDSGQKPGGLMEKISQTMPWNDSTIEIIMPTHFDSDHISGFAQVLDAYKVNLIILNDQKPDTELAKSLIEKIDALHIPVKHVKEGEKFQLPSGIEITFYNTQIEEGAASNDYSLVTRLKTKEETFLLTGDLEAVHEKKLVESKTFLQSEILKAGHHGSKTSTTEQFLLAANPKEVVLSYGENNRYGHPHKDVIDRLERYKIHLRKTAKEGDIVYEF